MSDKATAWMRTVVPALWSVFVAWLVTRVPALAPLADIANGIGVAVLVPIVLAGWKVALSAVEHKMPPWLVAVLLGSSATPVYIARPTPSVTVTEAPH